MDGKLDRMMVGYYRSKKNDMELYTNMCKKCDIYSIEEKITQGKHEFDTQINEGINTCLGK